MLRGRLEVLALEDLLERLDAVRSEILAIGLDLARAEFVATCQRRDSALREPADLVGLMSCLVRRR